MATINFTGTGGILEGNLGTSDVTVNLDKSLMFDGTNDFIDAGTDTDHDFTDHFTLACWAKNDNASTTGGDREHLIAKYEGSNGKRMYRLYLHGSTLRFGCGYNSGNSSVEITHSMTGLAQHWNHYAATFDGGVMKLYVNGVLVTNTDNSGTLTAIHANNAIELEIGAYQSGSHTWTGQMADVRIYNAVLTDANIQFLASKINTDSASGAGTSHLKGYWKLNNETASGGGSGTGFVVDESGTVNQGTLTNFSGTYWDYDAYYIDVQDNSTTTDGEFTVTQGKVEGLALTSLNFDGSDDYLEIGNDLEDWTELAQKAFSCWVYNDGNTSESRIFNTGSETTAGATAFGFGLDDGTDNKPFYFLRNTSGSALKAEFGDVHPTSTWMHYAIVQDGANNQALLYQNGVLKTTVSAVGEIAQNANATNAVIGRHWVASQGLFFDGKIRDVKLYDYDLSGDQVSSLYSGSYNVTPQHWWKIDDGGAHASGSATVEDYGTGTDYDATKSGAGWANGTLDLDGKLKVLANGTLSAPRGNLSLANNFDHAGTYIHNNGTFETAANLNINIIHSVDPVFYNFTNNNQVNFGGNNTRTFTIQNIHAGTGHNRPNGTITFNYGTSSASGTINTTGYWLHTNNNGTATIQATDTTGLNPVITHVNNRFDESFGIVSGEHWKWANINITSPFRSTEVSYSNAVTHTLLGDCKFSGTVEIDGNDNFDINGQRVHFGDVVTINSGGNIRTTDGGLIILDNSLIANGSIEDYDNKEVQVIVNGGSGHDWRLGQSGGGAHWCENILVNGNVTHIDQLGPSAGSSAHGPKNVIVGEGKLTVSGGNAYLQDLTIGRGGDMEMTQSTQKDIDLYGDLTLSGGIIGKSAMVVSGDNDYEGMSVTELQSQGDWGFSGSEGITIEGWFKFDDLDFGSGNDAILAGMVRSGDTTGKRYGLGLQIMDDKVMAIAANNDTAHTHYDDCSFPVSDLTAGKWHHLAMTADANNSSTPVTKLYLDGKLKKQVTGVTSIHYNYNFTVGGYADNLDSQGWTNRRMDGAIARCSAFRQEMTAAQIRSMMFTTYTEMAALSGGVDEAKCVGWWQFDEGQGTTVDNKGTAGAPPSSDHSNFDGVIASAGTTWADAGTFTESTSIIKMRGSNKNIYYKSGEVVAGLNAMDNSFTLTPVDVTDGTDTFTANYVDIESGATMTSTSGTLTIVKTESNYSLFNEGTFNHNNGKVRVDFETPNYNANSKIECNTLYDVEFELNRTTDLCILEPEGSGTKVTVLGDLKVIKGKIDDDADGDEYEIHGATNIEANGMFGVATDWHTGNITHHGLVTNKGTYYRSSAGGTVKMNSGIRNVGGTLA